MQSKPKQVFYLTDDNHVYTNYADIPDDIQFEECIGLLDLVCSAILSDATTAKLGKALSYLILVVVSYFIFRIIFNYLIERI